MHNLATVILRHRTRTGSHYDWLIDQSHTTPTRHPLTAMRLPHPPPCWLAAGAMVGDALPPHRRRYLRFQGSLTDHRGSVVRVDGGRCLALQWTDHQRLLAVRTRDFRGLMLCMRLRSMRWRAHALTLDALPGGLSPGCLARWLNE